MNLADIKEHEREQAQRRAAQKVDAKWRMRERQKKQNDAFIWSPENVAKIIRLNDKLWALMQDVVMDPEEFHIYTRVYNWCYDCDKYGLDKGFAKNMQKCCQIRKNYVF